MFYDRGVDVIRNSSTANSWGPGKGWYFGGHALTFSAAGFVTSATTDIFCTPQQIFGSAIYNPLGELSTVQMDYLYNQSRMYDKRGRYTGEVTIDVNNNPIWYGGTTYYPNGNVKTTSDHYAGNWNYTYDALNRISTAAGPSQSLQFGYDSFGNRTSQTTTAGSAPQWTRTYDASNHWTTGYNYDASGNLLTDGLHTYSYDAESRVATVDGSTKYLYDAEGDRAATYVNGQASSEYSTTFRTV